MLDPVLHFIPRFRLEKQAIRYSDRVLHVGGIGHVDILVPFCSSNTLFFSERIKAVNGKSNFRKGQGHQLCLRILAVTGIEGQVIFACKVCLVCNTRLECIRQVILSRSRVVVV